MVAKLSDFGLAVVEGFGTDQYSTDARGPSVGTKPYMPPEAFEGVISTKTDVYGLGVVRIHMYLQWRRDIRDLGRPRSSSVSLVHGKLS